MQFSSSLTQKSNVANEFYTHKLSNKLYFFYHYSCPRYRLLLVKFWGSHLDLMAATFNIIILSFNLFEITPFCHESHNIKCHAFTPNFTIPPNSESVTNLLTSGLGRTF